MLRTAYKFWLHRAHERVTSSIEIELALSGNLKQSRRNTWRFRNRAHVKLKFSRVR